MMKNVFIESSIKARRYFFIYLALVVFICGVVFPLTGMLSLISIRYLCITIGLCFIFWPAAYYFLSVVKKSVPFTNFPAVNTSLPFRVKQRSGCYAKLSGIFTFTLGLLCLSFPLFGLYGWSIENDRASYQHQLEIDLESTKSKIRELEKKHTEEINNRDQSNN